MLALAGCGGSPVEHDLLPPKIDAFRGPSSVSCAKRGDVKSLRFRYVTRNATAVRASIDGRSLPGIPLRFKPGRGTVAFPYTCPGPHTLRITAIGERRLRVSSSAGFDESNHQTSAESDEIVVAGG